MPVVHAKDVDLYYEKHGEGDPLLLINGWGSSSEMWSPFWRDLTAARQIIIFDNRGTGRSTISDKSITIPMMADDAINLIESLSISHADVLGASMGGMIAQELAFRHPENLRSLILCMTSFGGPHSIPVAEDVRRKLMMIASPPLGTPKEEIAKMWWSLIYTPEYVQKHITELAQQAKSIKYPTPPQTYRLQAEAMYRFDSYDRLSQIRVPTLIMAGMKDVLMSPENSKVMAQKIQNAGFDCSTVLDTRSRSRREN